MKQFDTHCTPNKNIVMETGGRETFVIGRSICKCSSSLTVSKHARVPQMEIEDRVRMQRPCRNSATHLGVVSSPNLHKCVKRGSGVLSDIFVTWDGATLDFE